MHTTVGSTDLPNSMGHGPLGPTSSDSPVSPFEAHLWEETENQQAIILPVNGHHKLLMLHIQYMLPCTAFCPKIHSAVATTITVININPSRGASELIAALIPF